MTIHDIINITATDNNTRHKLRCVLQTKINSIVCVEIYSVVANMLWHSNDCDYNCYNKLLDNFLREITK